MNYEKTTSTNLKVTTEKVTTSEQNYSLDYLKEQEVLILKSINDFVEAKKTELEAVRVLIAKCEELGVRDPKEVQAEELQASKAQEEAKVDNIEIK